MCIERTKCKSLGRKLRAFNLKAIPTPVSGGFAYTILGADAFPILACRGAIKCARVAYAAQKSPLSDPSDEVRLSIANRVQTIWLSTRSRVEHAGRYRPIRACNARKKRAQPTLTFGGRAPRMDGDEDDRLRASAWPSRRWRPFEPALSSPPVRPRKWPHVTDRAKLYQKPSTLESRSTANPRTEEGRELVAINDHFRRRPCLWKRLPRQPSKSWDR